MASFAHFVGVRRSCRALQFILTATDAAIATQKPNGKLNTPVGALTSTRQASFCQHGRSLPSPPEISAFYSRLNHAYMHPLTCVKYGAAALIFISCYIFNTRYYIIVIAPLKTRFSKPTQLHKRKVQPFDVHLYSYYV